MEPEDPVLHGQVLEQLEADGPVIHRLMTDDTETEPSLMPRTRTLRHCRTCRCGPSLHFVVTDCYFDFFKQFFNIKLLF